MLHAPIAVRTISGHGIPRVMRWIAAQAISGISRYAASRPPRCAKRTGRALRAACELLTDDPLRLRLTAALSLTMPDCHGGTRSLMTRRCTNTRFYPSRGGITGSDEDRRRFLESARISLGLPSLFYASLRSHRVFETVTGRAMDELRWERAAIRGYRLGIAEAGTGFPGIFPAPGNPAAELECMLVHDLGRFEQTMVAWYEWDEYALHQITLSDGRRAQVFIPDPEAIRREHGSFEIAPWSFGAWCAAGPNRVVANAREWMAQRPDDATLARAGFCAPQTFRRDQRAVG